MIELRPFAGLGQASHGWLQAVHHFSFAEYWNPQRMNWGALRVWNDDTIAAQSGFPTHPHADMEIITYVREGAITHQDSMGNRGRTDAGDVQVMSAGRGVRHSEYNLEDHASLIFQIWIQPDQSGGEPAWGSRPFPKSDRAGQWVVLASGMPQDTQALRIGADARVLGATVSAGSALSYTPKDPSRHLYLVAATGRVRVNGVLAQARDGVAIRDEAEIRIEAEDSAELVLVDVRA